MRPIWSLPLLVAATLTAGSALAQQTTEQVPIIGQPAPGAIGFQPAASPTAEDIHFLGNMVDGIGMLIVLLVVSLLGVAMFRFNRKRNPVPATYTHNSPLEIAWTIVPVLILVFIGSFSLPILFNQQEIPEADLTIKATGFQWYWNYEYPDSEFSFDSFMVPRDQLEDYGYTQDEYRLAADAPMVVPVGATVVVQVTGADVIHSWAVPALGVKQDGVPGRLAELWFRADREGIFFGQCSELCGKDHAFMPITVKAVSPEAYEAWLQGAVAEFAGVPQSVTVASAE